jgi:hypothetical protein
MMLRCPRSTTIDARPGGRFPMTPVQYLTGRVCAEFLKMPVMPLTLPQAQRLWGLDADTCDDVVAMLVARKVLRREAPGKSHA